MMTLGNRLLDSARLGFGDIAHIGHRGAGRLVVAPAEAVLLAVAVQQQGRAAGHRTVEEDRHVAQAARLAQLPEVVDQRLRAAHRERGNDHRAAALHGAFDHFAQCLHRVARHMAPVAIRRFDHHDVRPISDTQMPCVEAVPVGQFTGQPMHGVLHRHEGLTCCLGVADSP